MEGSAAANTCRWCMVQVGHKAGQEARQEAEREGKTRGRAVGSCKLRKAQVQLQPELSCTLKVRATVITESAQYRQHTYS